MAGYIKLGGLSLVQMELLQIDNYYLLGRPFEGRYKCDTVRNYFNEMQVHLQDGIVEEHPVIIYDKEPTGNREISKIVAGIGKYR